MKELKLTTQKRIPGYREKKTVAQAFTLIELLVVIAIIAILASIILPVLASARLRALRAQDMNNIKEVADGMIVFTGDNNNVFPPAGWQRGTYQITWDTIIYSYLGGGSGQPITEMQYGEYAQDLVAGDMLGIAPGLKVLVCPFDALPAFPKDGWLTDAGGSSLEVAIKDYEMVASGQGQAYYGSLIQRPISEGLPDVSTPGFLGVGIYWTGANLDRPSLNFPGFPETVVRHPSGSIMLAEVATSQNAEGNVWPCCCCGPITSDGQEGGWGNLYQIDTKAPQTTSTLESGLYNEGQQLYKAQRNRFTYAFHDGHVEELRYQQTTNSAGGMWNINTAD